MSESALIAREPGSLGTLEPGFDVQRTAGGGGAALRGRIAKPGAKFTELIPALRMLMRRDLSLPRSEDAIGPVE